MLDLFAFVYRYWQARIRQIMTMAQNYEKLKRSKMGHLPTIVSGASNFFFCIKNYSNVYKEMSALSNTDQNLEAFSQSG